MNTLLARFSPLRKYHAAAGVGLVLAGFSLWWTRDWVFALIPAALFLLTSAGLLFLATRPIIEIHDTFLRIGNRRISWTDIVRVDRTGWISPLLVRLTLVDNTRVPIIYSGDLDSANALLRALRRSSRFALIDGIPHRQFWGESAPSETPRQLLPAPKYKLLREEDEAEVERLFQKLKTVGRLDPKGSDEK